MPARPAVRITRLGVAIVLGWLGLAAIPHAQDPAPQDFTPLKPGQFTWYPERAPDGPVVVIVSLPDQQAYVYRNGVGIGRSSVSTGKKGKRTPTGVFVILQKAEEHYSNLYNNAPMPYMQRLTWGGIALHAGHLPGYPASHGCIRLPPEFAKALFGITTKSTTVVIADRKSSGEATVRPGLLLQSAGLDTTDAPVPLTAAEGESVWTPEKSLEGPVSILVSGADRTVYVNRNGVLIGKSAINIVDPGQPLPSVVFVRLEGTSNELSTYVPGMAAPIWQTAGLTSPGPEHPEEEMRRRVRVPSGFARQVYDILVPGSTLVVTNRPAAGYTTANPDFAVMASDTPESPATAQPTSPTPARQKPAPAKKQ